VYKHENGALRHAVHRWGRPNLGVEHQTVRMPKGRKPNEFVEQERHSNPTYLAEFKAKWPQHDSAKQIRGGWASSEGQLNRMVYYRHLALLMFVKLEITHLQFEFSVRVRGAILLSIAVASLWQYINVFSF